MASSKTCFSPFWLNAEHSKYFTDVTPLHLIAVDAEPLGESLKWEPSRGGALFPHLYSQLKLSDVTWAKIVERDATGRALLDGLE